jgi:hypothetical protein
VKGTLGLLAFSLLDVLDGRDAHHDLGSVHRIGTYLRLAGEAQAEDLRDAAQVDDLLGLQRDEEVAPLVDRDPAEAARRHPSAGGRDGLRARLEDLEEIFALRADEDAVGSFHAHS